MTQFAFSQNLTGDAEHDRLRRTHLGQAHIAGTGPDGRTCRDCRFWHLWKREWRNGESERIPVTPSGGTDAPCNKPIAGKSGAKVPGSALACRFFEDRP